MQSPSFSDRLLDQLRQAALLPDKPPKTAEEIEADRLDLAARLDADIRANNERIARKVGNGGK